jgi:hypothetical protein
LLIEVFISCSVAGAVLGSCADECATTVGSSEVTICEQQDFTSEFGAESEQDHSDSNWTPPPPWILCEVYVSGGVEIPTFGTVWIKIREGERDCLDEKDYVPIPNKPAISQPVDRITDTETLQEVFKTSPSSPRAYVNPSERYYDEDFNFSVEKETQTKSGSLFDQPVLVRFTPKSASWSFGGSGFRTSHTFGEKGEFVARATVTYRVDYKPTEGGWVIDAGSIRKSSNSLLVTALALPRESRLVE